MAKKSKVNFRRRIVAAAAILGLAVALPALLNWRQPGFFQELLWGETQQTGSSSPETTPSTEPETEPTLPQSPYGSADFALDGGFLTCLSGEAMLGIDVSRYQGEIDWQQVKEAGIEFVMVRLGYRAIATGELNTDPRALENLAGAREAGLLVGAYFYSQATTAAEAEEEARYALAVLDGFELELPLTCDWEIASRTEGVDIHAATECVAAFCRVVEEAGYQAMLYFNTNQAYEKLELLELTDYAWWLAMYDTSGEFPCRFDMWQYSCTGSVPGIEGDVDLNVIVRS